MIKTIEAIIDEHGNIKLLEPIRPSGARRALVTILEESPRERTADDAVLSETSLGEDWNRPEEDQAWVHLQTGVPARRRCCD